MYQPGSALSPGSPARLPSWLHQGKPLLSHYRTCNLRRLLPLMPELKCARTGFPKLWAGGPRVKGTRPFFRRQRISGGRRCLHCQATSLPEAVDATLRNIISISAVLGISYAVLLAAASEPPQPPTAPLSSSRALPPAPTPGEPARGSRSASGRRDEDENFMWGLMGVISFLPLFDWLAWVLAAISDEDRAALYGIYAALYGSPLLFRGLNWQDPWVMFMLVLCVVHVQAERIAQTEPEALRSIRPVGAVGAALRSLLGGTGSLLAGLGGVIAEDSRRVVRRPGGRSSSRSPPAELGTGGDRLQLDQDPDLVGRSGTGFGSGRQLDPRRDPSRDPELEDFASQELREFDEQLKEAQRRRWGAHSGGRDASGGGDSG